MYFDQLSGAWAGRNILLISAVKSLKKVWNEQKKGQKMAEKNVSTSFRVLQAPESWSKYTTHKVKDGLITLALFGEIRVNWKDAL